MHATAHRGCGLLPSEDRAASPTALSSPSSPLRVRCALGAFQRCRSGGNGFPAPLSAFRRPQGFPTSTNRVTVEGGRILPRPRRPLRRPPVPQKGPVVGSVRPWTCSTVETVAPSRAPPMGFSPAQRLSAGQWTALSARSESPREDRHGPGSQPRASPISAFLRPSWVVPNLPCDHSQVAPAHRVLPSEPFSPRHPSSAFASDALLGVTSVAGRPPSRGCGMPRSRTVTWPCCRHRQAVALLGVPVRPRGYPSGRHVRARLRGSTVVLPRFARRRGKTTDSSANRACSKRRFFSEAPSPESHHFRQGPGV